MAGMARKMHERAVKATSAVKSPKIIKTVRRCDVVALNRTMEPIMRQNEKEMVESEKAVAGTIFGGRL